MQEETLQKHIDDLHEVKNNIAHKQRKLNTFKEKLYVDFEGDGFKGIFTLKFSQFPQKQGSIEKAIIDQLIKDYELDLQDDVTSLQKCTDFLEAIRIKKPYCEVDLFSSEQYKEPVIC